MDNRRFLTNVARQFASLNTRGERIAVRKGFTQEFGDQRYSVLHQMQGRDNHFQGIQRIGNHLLVTGSFPHSKKRADLLVFRLGSRGDDPGPWGSNIVRDNDPAPTDRLISYFEIDPELWHAGALTLSGNTAVVPLEDSGANSAITFVDLSNLEKPARITGNDILRDRKAGVCAVTPLPSGQLLLAVWTDSDKVTDGTVAPFHLDLYLSAMPGVCEGFRLAAHFFPGAANPPHAFHRKFQGLDFIWERGGAAEKLFLIGFENTEAVQPLPFKPGENRAYLFEIALPHEWLDISPCSPADSAIELPQTFARFLDARTFEAGGDWYNMDAAACAYVDSNQHLIIYSVHHFLSPMRGESGGEVNALKAIEFRAADFVDVVERIEDAWVELYEQPGLQGRRLTVLGPLDMPVSNTQKTKVDGKRFERVGSVRFQIPDTRAFVLYLDREWKGVGALVLSGTGVKRSVDIPGTAFSGRFRSCRFQSLSSAASLPGAIIV